MDLFSAWKKDFGTHLTGRGAGSLIGCLCGDGFEMIPGDAEVTMSHRAQHSAMQPVVNTVCYWPALPSVGSRHLKPLAPNIIYSIFHEFSKQVGKIVLDR